MKILIAYILGTAGGIVLAMAILDEIIGCIEGHELSFSTVMNLILCFASIVCIWVAGNINWQGWLPAIPCAIITAIMGYKEIQKQKALPSGGEGEESEQT